jgi:SAM-dependent methyltransferase
MRQNIYDDPRFIAGYQAMRARRSGAHETMVLPMLRHLIPDLAGTRVLDLGCGDGWFCRLAAGHDASHVVGVDPSERMLALAKQQGGDRPISYVRGFAEDVDLPARSFDRVVSVFALHYVADLEALVRRIASWLAPNGVFVAVLEHPIYLAPAPQREFALADAISPRWLLSGYGDEGLREEHWFVDGVVKYHRRLATIINAIIDAGLILERVDEPIPQSPADAATVAEGRARPVVLGLRARQPEPGVV